MQILNKTIQNFRNLKLKCASNFVSQEEDDYEESIKNHFDRIFVRKELIQQLINEANILKTNLSDLTGAQTLYSEYLQTQVELIVGTLLPTARGERIKSLNDIIELPKWLENVGIAAQILEYLDSPKNLLSRDIEQECFKQTRLSSQWERVLIISKLPIEMKRSEIKEKIIKIVKKNRGILRDIYIPKGDMHLENSETKKEIKEFFKY